MAVSIQELINQKDKIEQKKQETFDLDTSVGKLTVKKITKGLMAEIMAITDGSDSMAVAYIHLQDQGGKAFFGVGIHPAAGLWLRRTDGHHRQIVRCRRDSGHCPQDFPAVRLWERHRIKGS